MDSEILAAIIGAMVTAAIAGLAWLFREYRNWQGNFVKIIVISESQAVKFSDDLVQNLKIAYRGKLLDNLYLTRLRIINNGKALIEPLEFTLQFIGDPVWPNFVDLKITDHENATTITPANDMFAWTIKRDYLKPKRSYKNESIELAITSDLMVKPKATGGGKNWALKVTTLDDLQSSNPENAMAWAMVVLSLITGILAITFITIPDDRIPESLAGFVETLLLVTSGVISGAAIYVIYAVSRRLYRRLRK